MKLKNRLYFLIILFGSVLLYRCDSPNSEVDFSSQVKPLLNAKCISCHGGVKKNAGFSVLFEEEAMASLATGHPAIVPGQAEKSRMIEVLTENDIEQRMPYRKPALSREEIQLLSDWIDQGAKWGTHWAYIPPVKNEIPSLSSSFGEWGSKAHPIDGFIGKKMGEENLVPNPKAPLAVLARRAALDLTGLPPNRILFDSFVNQQMTYSTYLDRLLENTAFGEHWASWWLDLARYADSRGYEKDPARSIWPYRDWVIRAFNQDMPFDRFTQLQLAGDLMPNPSADELVATGFHRNTMNNDEGGTEDEEFRVAAVIDRVNTTFDVWQSTTMSCVQCHSHPYDPIKHKQYYELMAFFNNTRDEDTPDEAPIYRGYSAKEEKKLQSVVEWVKEKGSAEKATYFERFAHVLEPKFQLHNCTDFVLGELSDSKYLALWNNGSAFLRNVDTQGHTSLYFYYSAGVEGTVITLRKNGPKGAVLGQLALQKANWTVAKIPFAKQDEPFDLYIEAKNNRLGPEQNTSRIHWFAFAPDLPGKKEKGYAAIEKTYLDVLNAPESTTPILVENPSFMQRETRLFERGSWLAQGELVTPNVPENIAPWDVKWEKNRLGLAQWLVSDNNPLTARTLVNRIWAQLFGKGLVTTLEDLGTQSEPPTHPELLDWLSVDLMTTQQWRIKTLLKTIMTSSTYQQSSQWSEEKHTRDPLNTFYAVGPKKRLTAEQIRDQALYVAQLLSKKMYGPGVMPPQPDGVWEHQYLGNLWKESKGEDRYRRAVYTFYKRTSPYPSFVSFDAGSREVCLINRTPTNTPLQALVTLNDPVFLEAAYAFARRYPYSNSPKSIISSLYEDALYSTPSEKRVALLLTLYEAAIKEYTAFPEQLIAFFGTEDTPEKEVAALAVVANAVMNLDEFLTRS